MQLLVWTSKFSIIFWFNSVGCEKDKQEFIKIGWRANHDDKNPLQLHLDFLLEENNWDKYRRGGTTDFVADLD